jgi:uncharacterized protein YjiS (DUF1127 family)
MTSIILFPTRARHRFRLADFGKWVRASLWTRVRALLALWVDRNRERRHLLAMSELQHRDIGVTRCDVRHEVNKPFWRG